MHACVGILGLLRGACVRALACSLCRCVCVCLCAFHAAPGIPLGLKPLGTGALRLREGRLHRGIMGHFHGIERRQRLDALENETTMPDETEEVGLPGLVGPVPGGSSSSRPQEFAGSGLPGSVIPIPGYRSERRVDKDSHS